MFTDFEVELRILDFQPLYLLSAGLTSVIHIHTAFGDVEVVAVAGYYDNEGILVKSKFLKPGQRGKVILRASKPIAAEKYEINNYLGSFVLRDQGISIAVGKI